MPTFAHTESGTAVDVQVDASMDAYLRRFSPEFTAKWTAEQVPDGTMSGAKRAGDGTWVNPQVAPPTSVPLVLSKTAFQDYAVSQLGGGLKGMARFQDIMDACAAASGAVRFCFSRYVAADTFAQKQVEVFTDIMVGAGIMQRDEQSSILANWP